MLITPTYLTELLWEPYELKYTGACHMVGMRGMKVLDDAVGSQFRSLSWVGASIP